MKCVLVLVVVNLCYAMGLYGELNNEMIKNLRTLHNSKCTITSDPERPLRVPVINSTKKVSDCVGAFKIDLLNVLNNGTTGCKNGMDALKKLKWNLKDLPEQQYDENCTQAVVSEKCKKFIFKKYETFVRRLNNLG